MLKRVTKLLRCSVSMDARLPLVVLLLLLLQYTSLIDHYLARLGQFRAIPVTLIFLTTLAVLPLASRISSAPAFLVPCGAIRSLIFLGWIVSTVWSYTKGSAFSAIGARTFLIIAIVSGFIFLVAIMRQKTWMHYAAITVFTVSMTVLYIRHQPFASVFVPGRPLWNVRDAALRLSQGHWIYHYGSTLSPAYPPLLFFPYLPFGLLGWDLRWVNLSGVLVILWTVFWITRRLIRQSDHLLVAVVFLSPVFLSQVLTTQVVFYWLYLTLFTFAACTGRASLQKSALLAACLSRPLAWPLVLPWLVVTWPSSACDTEGDNMRPPLMRRLRQQLQHVKPNLFDAVMIGCTAAIALVAPRAFFWSTLILPNSDGLRAISFSSPQPAGGIALTPLLPFALNHSLVLAAQLLVVIAVCYMLWRANFLQTQLAYSYILIYAAFLCLNFVVYDYYWVDIIIMALITMLLVTPDERHVQGRERWLSIYHSMLTNRGR